MLHGLPTTPWPSPDSVYFWRLTRELCSDASVPAAKQLSFQPGRRGLNADEGGEHYFSKVWIGDGTHRLPI